MDGNASVPRFPLPSEIADAPGAEGWRSMYPYFTRFQPEDDKRFWFYNSMHFPEPMPAFDTITAEVPYSAIGANTARVFVFPTTLGIEHRIVNGRVYITANPVTDPDEIGRRAAIFGERAGYYYENWDTLYQGWKMRIKGLIDEITSITVPELPEFDDLAVVTESRGVAQNHYVRENFHRCIDLFSVMWHHHTEFLMLGYGAYVVFFQFCKQAFPEISDQAVARMVAGIDVIMYRPDDELRGLARLAVEAGVADLFTEGCSPPAVLAALTERGLTIKPGTHPIVPIMLGDAALSQKFAARMLEKGVYVIGFFYPVVPHGTARVRTQVSAAHNREELEHAVKAFAETSRELSAQS